MEQYRMPVTGKITSDVDEYCDAWRDIARPIEEAFGMKLAAFDPGLSFVDGKDYITLPTWFVLRFKVE